MNYSAFKSISTVLALASLSFGADKLDVCNCKPRAGLEFSAAQHRPGSWNRWDWQCAYTMKYWRTWDNGGSKWVDTTVPCVRPTAYKWQHVVLEGQRVNGNTVFISFTVDGVKHYVNKTFSPKTVTTTTSWVTFHFQLNGGSTQKDYSVWDDKFKLTYW
jgi:hypothetical protein